MFSIQDHLSVARKAKLEANLAMYTALTRKMLETVEKLADLNIATARASTEEATATARKMLTAKDPQEFVSMINAQLEPGFERALAYGSRFVSITGAAQAEFIKVAEAQVAQANRKATEWVEEVAKKGPNGSMNIAKVVKTAIGSANNSYEQLTRTAKQAVDVMESNMTTIVESLSQGVAAKG